MRSGDEEGEEQQHKQIEEKEEEEEEVEHSCVREASSAYLILEFLHLT